MYAIVKTGGKQYTVRENERILVEKLDIPVGEKVELKEVLFVGGDKEVIGAPVVNGALVSGKVLRHDKDKKIIGFTYKRRKNESRRYGHRQQYTEVLIEKIAYKKPRAKAAKTETTTEEQSSEE